jgi:hypothetical protein
MPVPQQTLELHHTALTGFQEHSQLFQQRCECPENGLMTFQLVGQLAATTETLAETEAIANIRTPTRQPIKCGKRINAETPREASTR